MLFLNPDAQKGQPFQGCAMPDYAFGKIIPALKPARQLIELLFYLKNFII
jgi:hypothetical protein